jgi:GTPase SAR1 family protein
MSKSVIQPLESYRLAEYAVPIPCYICGTDNTFDSEFCTHCQAPMALAHQANSQKVTPSMVAVVGSSGVGKTVYMGMLMDMLSRQSGDMNLFVRGAFSITLQQTTVSALAKNEFPKKTPNEPDRWNWVHCQISSAARRQPLELIMPDMAGEAVLEEVDHPHTYRVVRSFLEKCGGAMILIDSLKLQDGNRDQDYFTMKLASYLDELHDNENKSWAKRPVALVFTKADQCDECMDNPAEYAQHHAAGLWQQCQQRFPLHKFFATGVSGACAKRESMTEGRVNVPLRIEPRGITEPFKWLLGGM